MSFEMMVGLNVTDDACYAKYREEMTPILESFGGGFRYDFVVYEVLKNEEKRPVNRVFAIYFESEESMNLCFNDANYKAIKERYFKPSVSDTTIISSYHR